MSSCGTSALSNALQAVGFDAPAEAALLELAGGTADGTGAAGLKRAASKLGAKVGRIATHEPGLAWAALTGLLAAGSSAILIYDVGQHWVSAVGLLGRRVLVVDPAMVVRPMIGTYDETTLMKDWRWRREWYAITLTRP